MKVLKCQELPKDYEEMVREFDAHVRDSFSLAHLHGPSIEIQICRLRQLNNVLLRNIARDFKDRV